MSVEYIAGSSDDYATHIISHENGSPFLLVGPIWNIMTIFILFVLCSGLSLVSAGESEIPGKRCRILHRERDFVLSCALKREQPAR